MNEKVCQSLFIYELKLGSHYFRQDRYMYGKRVDEVVGCVHFYFSDESEMEIMESYKMYVSGEPRHMLKEWCISGKTSDDITWCLEKSLDSIENIRKRLMELADKESEGWEEDEDVD